jgi:hypothetical protein
MLPHFIRSTTERILFITITMGFLFTIVLGIQLIISIRFKVATYPGPKVGEERHASIRSEK